MTSRTKRVFDLGLALPVVVILLPLMTLVAALVVGLLAIAAMRR